jgi:hypothetical protein
LQAPDSLIRTDLIVEHQPQELGELALSAEPERRPN